MPLINVDIFDDLPLRLKKNVNQYLDIFTQAHAEGSLPMKYGPELQGMRGGWQSFITKQNASPVEKLIVEIGVHKAKVLRALAQKHPSFGFIGMDITFKRVVVSAQRLKEDGANNAAIVLGNAKAMTEIYADNELDGVIIFFPDPWTKKSRQIKNRLINPEFCQALKKVLKEDGFFWLKTDSSDYFHNAASLVEELGFVRMQNAPFEGTYESVFEKRFKDQGLSTYEGAWLNKKDAVFPQTLPCL